MQSWVNSFSVAFYKLFTYYIEVNLLKTQTAQELYKYPNLTFFFFLPYFIYMHFCPHLTFLKLEYVLLLILPCNVVGWAAIGAITIVWTNTNLVMVVHTSITFVAFSTLLILCLGFSLYLKYLQRIIFCFGTETDSLCREARK